MENLFDSSLEKPKNIECKQLKAYDLLERILSNNEPTFGPSHMRS